MMWIPIITSLVCFAVATILFTPPLRKFPFYQAVSFYFLFEGAWTLFNYPDHRHLPYADFMIGSIMLGSFSLPDICSIRFTSITGGRGGRKKGRRSRLPGKRSFPKKNDEEKKDGKTEK